MKSYNLKYKSKDYRANTSNKYLFNSLYEARILKHNISKTSNNPSNCHNYMESLLRFNSKSSIGNSLTITNLTKQISTATKDNSQINTKSINKNRSILRSRNTCISVYSKNIATPPKVFTKSNKTKERIMHNTHEYYKNTFNYYYQQTILENNVKKQLLINKDIKYTKKFNNTNPTNNKQLLFKLQHKNNSKGNLARNENMLILDYKTNNCK